MVLDYSIIVNNTCSALLILVFSTFITYCYYTIVARNKKSEIKIYLSLVENIVDKYKEKNVSNNTQTYHLEAVKQLSKKGCVCLRFTAKKFEKFRKAARKCAIQSARLFLKEIYPDQYNVEELTSVELVKIALKLSSPKQESNQ